MSIIKDTIIQTAVIAMQIFVLPACYGLPIGKIDTGQSAVMSYKDFPKFPNGSSGIFVVMSDAPTGWKPRYALSQCLVQVQIGKNGKDITPDQWMHIQLRSGVYWLLVAPKIGISAFNYQSNKGSIYILFAKNCDRRITLTKQFFDDMKASIIKFPDYIVLDHIVVPSSETLYLCGHWWTDGEQKKCFLNLAPEK